MVAMLAPTDTWSHSEGDAVLAEADAVFEDFSTVDRLLIALGRMIR
jgi:hypothetical protein